MLFQRKNAIHFGLFLLLSSWYQWVNEQRPRDIAGSTFNITYVFFNICNSFYSIFLNSRNSFSHKELQCNMHTLSHLLFTTPWLRIACLDQLERNKLRLFNFEKHGFNYSGGQTTPIFMAELQAKLASRPLVLKLTRNSLWAKQPSWKSMAARKIPLPK